MNLTLTIEQAQMIIQNRTAMIDDHLLRTNIELDLMYTELDQVGEVSFPITPYDLDKFFLNRLAYLSVTTYVQRLIEEQVGRGVDYVDNYNSDVLHENIDTWSAMILDKEGNTDRENEIKVKVEIGEEIVPGI